MDNPVLYSDLIKDDGAIQNLINQLNEAINAFDTAKGKLQATATDLTKSLQSISGATEEQRQSISRAVQDTEKLIESYKNQDSAQRAAYREKQKVTQAQKEAQQIDKLTIQLNNAKKGSYNALSAEYRLLKIELNAMSEAERKTAQGQQMEQHARALYEQMSNLQKATGKYTLEVGHYQNAMLGLAGPFGQVTNAIQHLGANMRQVFASEAPASTKALAALKVGVLGVITVLVAMGKAMSSVISKNAEFEQANADLAAVLGKANNEISNLTETAMSLGRTTEWTASQVTQLQTELAKLGFGEGSIIAMQKHVLAFATAVGADLAEAATMAGAAIRAFNLTSSDSERVMGTLAVAVNNSALTFERIKYAMGTVFPIANAFGLEIEDAAALLGALANAGFSAESAATATRNMLLNLADANGKLAQRTGGAAKSFDDIMDKLVQLRKEGADLSEIFELTDKRSVAAFNALMTGTEIAKELRQQLNDVNGELERIQQQKLDTIEGQTKILKSYWEGLKLSFRESNGIIKDIVKGLQEAVQLSTRLLFPEQTATTKAIDEWVGTFERFYETHKDIEEIDITNYIKERTEKEVEAIRGEIEKLDKQINAATALPAMKKYLKDQRATLQGEMNGIIQAADIVTKKIQNDISEITRQQELAREQQQTQEEELTRAQKAQRIKDLQARIEQIKMEISYTEKGTQEMLDRRLELVEAERELEIEKNRQAEETAKKDVSVINNKYNHDRTETEKAFWNEVSGMRIAALQADKKVIDDEISVTRDGTQRMLDLKIASLEKQREIEIEQNRQKDEQIRQNEQTITDKYDMKILMMRDDFNTKMAKQDLERLQELQSAEFELMESNERQKTIFRLEQEWKRLNRLLEINEEFNGQMGEQEKAAIKARMDAITKELGSLPYNNIYEVLGLRINENQQDALKDVWQATKSILDDIADSYMKLADASVKSADEQVNAAQKVLDSELEAQREGYASSVDSARKELDLAKKQREEALKEREKAKRAQIAIDTMEQTSSLITASANIWKAFSPLGPLGIAGAIAGIATMWSSFAVSRVKAIQLAKQEYGEGTVELLEGGSHASGNDIDLGYDRKKHRRRRAEGGEFFAVINRRNSRKYRNVIPDVIKSFNDGSFADKYQKANTVMDGNAISIMNGPDISGLERNVKAIRQQGERQVYSDGKDIVIRYKNLIQRFKI